MIPKLNAAVLLSAGLMLGSALLRMIYYMGVNEARGEFWWQAVLPVTACVLFTASLLADAGDRPHRTAVPVVLGCIFFAVKAAGFSPGHRLFCWLLYLLTAGLYYATVRHGLNKWFFGGLVGCALAYHAVVEDAVQHRFLELYTTPRAVWTPDWWYFLAELTVLMTMTALLLATFSMEKRERQGWTPVWGDRNDGRRLRTVNPVWRISPYIMLTRNTSSNFLRDSMECTALDAYVHRKRREGLRGFGALHVVLAAYARCVAQYPGVNRFISGQRAYSRQEIEIAMNVKPEMTLESVDTVIKLYLSPTDTAEDVYRKLQEKVASIKAAPDSNTSFDVLTHAMNMIPGPALLLATWSLRFLDYFGCLPRALTKLSPFHGSLYITSMASLGIPPIFHHLYDFGNVPVFVSLGKKYRVKELSKTGDVVVKRYIDYTFVTDERICDGFYFASVLRFFRGILQNPECLDTPAEAVVQDIR
ncbi:MAG: hypothetical protein K2O18_16535 [Oscillospiraceae bacterium]|nr:hypothetical protein [Oscillospiraceae bacterium]